MIVEVVVIYVTVVLLVDAVAVGNNEGRVDFSFEQ